MTECVLTGGICHETTTFVATKTSLRDFEKGFGLYRGEEMFPIFRGTNKCLGGFIDGATRHGLELIPLLWTFAYPGGVIERDTYEALKADFLERARTACRRQTVSGALLDLHGSMVIEGIDDGESDLIESLRAVIGPGRPIVVTTDLHANHTRRRVQAADIIVGFDTYPHVDMAERGREAVNLIVDTIRRRIRPTMAIRQIPLFWTASRQVTSHPPMDEVLRRVHELEKRPGVVSATVATGFQWADVPEAGSSVIVVTDNDVNLAQVAADELGDWIWQNRERWYAPPLSVRAALAQGQRQGKFPILLADHADNTGGGAPGDSTEVLRTFLDLDLRDALLLYMVDPEVAQLTRASGVGSRVQVRLGGKSSPFQGSPVSMDAEVVAVSDGAFAYDGPMYAGLKGNMGASAWLRERGISVVVVTSREQPLDPGFARTLGIDCRQFRYIALKSAVHFRSGFEPIAGQIFNVDAAAILSHDVTTLPWRQRTRPMFPSEIKPRAT